MSADPADKYRWILKSSSTTQGQVFYVMAKNGALMVLQLVYSSMNSWSHSVQAGCRIHIPGQPPKTLNVSLGASAMQISPDKLSVTANPIAITHTAPLTFHLTYKKDDVDVNVDFACVGSDVCFNGGDEKWHKATREGGFIKAHFIPRASVSGTIKVGDITHDAHGVGSAVFAVQNMPQNVARFDLMIFHGDNDWLFLYQVKKFDAVQDAN